MDKLSEWIERAIEQGDDRPIELPNQNSQKKASSSNTQKQTQQQSQNHRQKPKTQHPQRQKGQQRPQRSPNSQQKPKPQHPPKPQHSQKRKGQNRNQNRTPNPSLAKAKKKPGQPLLNPFRGLRIIPIGGLDEVGKNMTVIEYNRTGHPKDKEIIVIDMGLQFPEEDMLGVDYVIPDGTYLEENRKHIKGIIITHGHLDHTGGIPYLLPKLDFPQVFATRLTRGLIEGRIKEFNIEKQARLHTIDPKESLRLGSFKVEFFRVAHSIPDAVGVIMTTPEGKIVHTGDFKFDDSPAGNQPKANLKELQALGDQNILALLSDSTNATRPGHTMSESEVGRNIEDLIAQAKGRVIIASFSSLIGRIQQIFDYAEKSKRNIYISGRSMKENIKIALNLGYLKIKTNQIRDIKKVGKAKDDEAIILTTGSQGEAVSALTKISMNDHPQVKIKKGDTVIVSASPIIGNERSIFTVINGLCKLGARVIHSQIMDIHTSGHGYQDELTQMILAVKPKYLIPMHGEYFMRQAHKELGMKTGLAEKNCILVQNGDVLEISQKEIQVSPRKVPANYILIDGLGEGTIGSQVMVDRQKMSLNGILVIILPINKKTKELRDDPNIVSRGFMYMHEYDKITDELAKLTAKSYRDFIKTRPDADRKEIKRYIIGVADRYATQTLERKPLILPLVFES